MAKFGARSESLLGVSFLDTCRCRAASTCWCLQWTAVAPAPISASSACCPQPPQRTVANALSHELRIPITLIGGYASRLQHRVANLSEPEQQQLALIHSEATRDSAIAPPALPPVPCPAAWGSRCPAATGPAS